MYPRTHVPMLCPQILFCTLNTHKVDMTHLLGGQIGLDDFIFAHRKGGSPVTQRWVTRHPEVGHPSLRGGSPVTQRWVTRHPEVGHKAPRGGSPFTLPLPVPSRLANFLPSLSSFPFPYSRSFPSFSSLIPNPSSIFLLRSLFFPHSPPPLSHPLSPPPHSPPLLTHLLGVAKEVEIVKTEDALGLTITDNGAGYAFIKRIKEGSVIDKLKLVVEVGDHIERIDGTSLVGRRHFEVAKLLKEIPRGASFVMRLVQPLKAGFANIGPRSDPRSGSKKGLGSGKQTLRFKANGQAQVEDVVSRGLVHYGDDHATVAIEKINSLLENFLGINDNDLAAQIWDLGQGKQNTMEFAEAVDDSDLESFGFNDDFIFELWGAITDAKSGRLKRV
ncbi:hypothetical protein HAZT_HAZT004798 [Hyalella azteca]|uniref:PDZ domain-containing protein n=1 Tax=Hyalella azteca TaxID=294128 RepID=A0A6A0HED9_HYAAZ|nr:hypothetical protein HAZT_HAZT004798 [Hyalella azteca]